MGIDKSKSFCYLPALLRCTARSCRRSRGLAMHLICVAHATHCHYYRTLLDSSCRYCVVIVHDHIYDEQPPRTEGMILRLGMFTRQLIRPLSRLGNVTETRSSTKSCCKSTALCMNPSEHQAEHCLSVKTRTRSEATILLAQRTSLYCLHGGFRSCKN